MIFRPKTFITAVSLGVLFVVGASSLFANPYEELTPDKPLYQRVKHLEVYGVLDPQDQKVLDDGKIVTRLELAFYTEKAKARLTAPQLLVPTPTFTPAPIPTEAPIPTAIPTPVPTVPQIPSAARSEIDELLKELKDEAAMLKSRMTLDDQRINEQEKQLEALQNVQDDVSSAWKKANKSIGVPNFNTKARFKFENLYSSGITVINATRTVNEVDLGMWSDLGGKGAISLGLGTYLYDSNASSGPASLSVYAPDVNYQLDGPLGHWDSHFVVQAYPGAGTLGDFTRGVQPTTMHRYVNPVDVKHYSDDKDTKTWDDYISNISPVPPTQAGGAIVSSYDPVFDGVYGVGTNLPLLGSDSRMVLMIGRQGSSKAPPQPARFEQGAKLTKPIGPFQTDISMEWMNDDFGINQYPQLDFKAYQADFSLNVAAVTFTVEAAFSHLYSGVLNGNPVPPNTALEAPAGQVQVSYYPLNFYYTAISDGFSNFNSKVAMAGVNFQSYAVYPGPTYGASSFLDAYGLVGEADELISDRYGWRANLGWDGRKQDWMKGWPSILDDIVINFDFTSKTEYKAYTNAEGYNVVEAYNILTPFFQEDEGIWGLDLWGGYASAPWLPGRQQYDTNIQAFRNDGNTSGDNTRYMFTQNTERVPLILPVPGEPVSDVNGQPVTNGPGNNTYINLTHLKTYNLITLTTKLQLNKMLGIDTPFYGSFFMTNNVVSGKSTTPGQPDISNLFEQDVFDFGAMYQVFHNVNVMGECGWETWTSNYTFPLINYRTDVLGAGLAYDIPWGGGKWELRYKDITFHDTYVPASNYHVGQWFSELFFLF